MPLTLLIISLLIISLFIPAVRWTADRPTAPGWYWTRGDKVPVEYRHFAHVSRADIDKGTPRYPAMGILFAGPLPAPKEDEWSGARPNEPGFWWIEIPASGEWPGVGRLHPARIAMLQVTSYDIDNDFIGHNWPDGCRFAGPLPVPGGD